MGRFLVFFLMAFSAQAAEIAIVVQDQTSLRAAPRGSAQQQALLWQGEALEIRGELKSIPSNVPGLDVCELLPRMARVMDKVTVIRSVSQD